MIIVKTYTIVCRYFVDGKIIDIELSRMLKRLNISPRPLTSDGIEWGIDYGVKHVIRHNVNHGYKVRYCIKLISSKGGIFEYGLNKKRYAEEYAAELNNDHDDMIKKMSLAKFKKIFKKYGNDYTKQIKGED